MTPHLLRRARRTPAMAALALLALASAPIAPAAAASTPASITITSASREAPGGTIPAVVTVRNVPAGYTVSAISAVPATTNKSRGVVTCTGGTWHNPQQKTTSRTCHLRLGPDGSYKVTGSATLTKPGAKSLTVTGTGTKVVTAAGYRAPSAMPQASIDSISRCGNTTRNVWLTFDDGGSTAQVRQILDTLKKNNVKGRFFMNGTWRDKNPTLMREITSAGHILGNHSYDHPSLETLNDKDVLRQIDKGVKSTAKPMLLRPPYGAGSFNTRMTALAKSKGYTLCRWTHDTSDWAGTTKAQMVEALCYGNETTAPIEAGGVVLMHGTAKHTAGSLQAIIDTIRAKNLPLERLR